MTSQEKSSDPRDRISGMDSKANDISGDVVTEGQEGTFFPNTRKGAKTMTEKEKADVTRWVDFHYHRYQRWAGRVLSTIGILASVGFLVALFIVEVGQSGAMIDLVKAVMNSYVGAALIVAWVLRPLLGMLSEMWRDRQSNS